MNSETCTLGENQERMDFAAEVSAVPNENTLLERVSLALQAAGMMCWEYSYTERCFTWFDTLPEDIDVRATEIQEASRSFIESIFEEDNIALRKATKEALAEGATGLSFVVRRRDPVQGTRHCHLQQRFFRDESGRALRAVGTMRDITDVVSATEEIRHQKELLADTQRRLERASLSSQEGHWEIELPTGRHWASKSYLALLGYPESSFDLDTLDKVTAIVHSEDAQAVQSAAESHLATGSPYDVEARLRAMDGEYRWFRLRGSAERDDDGRPLRASGSIHDIHKQRLAEDALRDVEARFARAIEGTQDGLWEIDFDRHSIWLSPRLLELIGYQEGDLPNNEHALLDLIHPDDRPIAQAATRDSVERHLALDFEARMRTRTGEYRWYRVRGTPRMEYPQGRRSSGSIQDITEQRAARDVLIQATEAAQAANRAKSGFIANVSHEIRTPMNGIIGMTRLLLDTMLDPTQRDYTETVRASADSLLNVINDILDFSKIEAGKLDIESLEMDLPANIEEIGSTMAFQAAAKNLELIINVHPDVPPHVLGDPQRIRQCIINLLGNAIKFTRSGEIVCEVSVVSSAADVVNVRFAVHDTGIGIAAATLKALFQPFTQADASTTRHYGGTGLGLSIVHRLVELMGGQIGVASTIGKGSTFWFMLPMVRVAAPPGQAPASAATAGRRLLVVDDNETNRRVLQTQLFHAGYDVMVACSGREALTSMRLAIAAARPFDAALIDFQMPDMDGAALAQSINADPQLQRTRAVLLTSMDRHGDLGRFAAMGFAGYLTKPVRRRDLLVCLDRVLIREARDWHVQTQPIVTANIARGASDSGRFSGRVLLAEDNAVNQKVARRFLERMGCEVTAAETGAEAVRACAEGSFRLVLMDVQMPVMDGYEATRQIRSLEIAPAHIPIVALTANAMSGQLERCVEAGMDALLTKPLDVEQLEETLERFGLSAKGITDVEPHTDVTSVGARPTTAPIDLARLEETTEGDTAFAADLLQSYLVDSSGLLAQIRASVSLGDRRQLAHAVHQLRGSSANIHAVPLRDACSRLEQAALEESPALLERLVAQLAEEAARVRDAVENITSGFASDLA
jgi:PAS domain S-box-containing protein